MNVQDGSNQRFVHLVYEAGVDLTPTAVQSNSWADIKAAFAE